MPNLQRSRSCHKKIRICFNQVFFFKYIFLIWKFVKRCDNCKGKGKTFKTKCHVCEGTKLIDGSDNIFLYIERGIPDRYLAKVENGADEHADKPAADIIF